MYLKSGGSYYVGTEQRSRRAPFLLLFAWNDFKALDELRAGCAECRRLAAVRNAAIDAWNSDPLNPANDRNAFDWPAVCEAHTGIKSKVAPEVYTYPNGKGKIWAAVRSVALHQCGHFMMGSARIAGARIGVSGAYGADGLPGDLQDVPIEARDRLVLMPEDIAAVYWSGDGHNSAGSEAPTVRAWALQAFASEVK